MKRYWVCSLLILANCAALQEFMDDMANVDVTQSALESTNDAADSASTAETGANPAEAGSLPHALSAACVTKTTDATDGNTVTFTLSKCAGHGGRSTDGTRTVTTTKIDDTHRVHHIVSHFVRTLPNGDTTKVDTDVTVTTVGKRSDRMVTRTIEINQDHRVRTKKNGKHDLDIELATDKAHPIVTVDTFGADNSLNQRLINGTATVTHNLLGTSHTFAFSNVSQASDCCYPTGGALGQSITSSDGTVNTMTYTFSSTCGTVVTQSAKGLKGSVEFEGCP